MENGEIKDILYKASASEAYLRPRWSVYANGCLFFVEGRSLSGADKFITQYINLTSGELVLLGTSMSRGDIVKLSNGCIFIGQDLLNFNKGIYYNPFTHNKYVGEDAVTDGELESAVYQDF